MTLWELITGGSPYKGLPHVALSQMIVFQHKRPCWPDSTPPEYKDLAEKCWQPDPSSRPSFDVILDDLAKMRAGVKDACKPIDLILARPPLESNKDGSWALGVAEYASINTGSDELGMPVIMGDPSPSTLSPPLVQQSSLVPESSKQISGQRSERSPSHGAAARVSTSFSLLNLDDLSAAAAKNKGGRMYGHEAAETESFQVQSLQFEIASIQAEASRLIRDQK